MSARKQATATPPVTLASAAIREAVAKQSLWCIVRKTDGTVIIAYPHRNEARDSSVSDADTVIVRAELLVRGART